MKILLQKPVLDLTEYKINENQLKIIKINLYKTFFNNINNYI
jgi:hypothetical protein